MSDTLPPLPEPEFSIHLDPPIAAPGGGTVSEITLREPTAGQVRQAEAHLRGGMNPEAMRKMQIALVVAVGKVSQAVVDQMPVSKLDEGWDYLNGFLYRQMQTGKA